MKIEDYKKFEYDCQDTQELLTLYLTCPEELTFDERDGIEQHLAKCDFCREDYEGMKFIGEVLIANRDDLRGSGAFSSNTPRAQFVPEKSRDEIMDERFHNRVERTLTRRKRREQKGRIDKIKRLIKPISAVAACLVLGIGLFFGIQSVDKPQDGPSPVAANLQQNPVQIELIAGGTTEIIPAGQSIIASDALKVLRINGNRQMVLNIGTALKIEPYNLGCLVKLDHGEIYTEVEHDSKLFIVETVHGRAVITGTTFNIKADNERMALAVVEGTVRFESDNGKVEVKGGNQSFIAAGRKPTEPVFCDSGLIARWARQEHLPELPSVASPRMDVTDLPGVISFLSQSYNLEEIDFDIWIEQHREWFKREFPWTKRMQKQLAEKGVQVDTIQLLIGSDDLWRFAWPEYNQQRFLAEDRQCVQKIASQYGVEVDFSISSHSSSVANEVCSIEAFEKWLNVFEKAKGNLTIDSIHAATFLVNTRSLVWYAIEADKVQMQDKQKCLDLLTEQVNAASNTLERLNRLLIIDKKMTVCSVAQYDKHIEILREGISYMMEVERELIGDEYLSK